MYFLCFVPTSTHTPWSIFMVHLARSVSQGCSAETAAHENKPDLRKYSLELSSEAMRAEISKEVKPTRRGGKKNYQKLYTDTVMKAKALEWKTSVQMPGLGSASSQILRQQKTRLDLCSLRILGWCYKFFFSSCRLLQLTMKQLKKKASLAINITAVHLWNTVWNPSQLPPSNTEGEL